MVSQLGTSLYKDDLVPVIWRSPARLIYRSWWPFKRAGAMNLLTSATVVCADCFFWFSLHLMCRSIRLIYTGHDQYPSGDTSRIVKPEVSPDGYWVDSCIDELMHLEPMCHIALGGYVIAWHISTLDWFVWSSPDSSYQEAGGYDILPRWRVWSADHIMKLAIL